MHMNCCCETQAGDGMRPTSERVPMLPLDNTTGQYDTLNLAKLCQLNFTNVMFYIMLRSSPGLAVLDPNFNIYLPLGQCSTSPTA